MSTNQFTFVSMKRLSKRTTAEDLQIRSHCMKGKNKRADSRRSRQNAKKTQLAASRETNATYVLDPRAGRFVECLWLLQCRSQVPMGIQSLPTLLQVDHGFSHLATNVQKSPKGLLNEFTIYLRVTEVTSMVDTLIDFNLPANRPELPPLDDVMVQGILLINSIAHDYSLKRSFTETSAPMLARIHTLLNQKLTTPEAFLEVTTVFTVAYLSTVAAANGDVAALGVHMAGLHKIMTLRGGEQSLWPWSKMQVKIESLDMILALSLGGDPFFIHDPIVCEGARLQSTPTPLSTAHAEKSCNLQPEDPTLHLVFLDLVDLIKVANRHFDAKEKVNVTVYHPRIHAISNHLLRLERRLSESSDACLCMGMLCFIVSLFQMPATYPAYAYIINRLKTTVEALSGSQQLPPQPILRWMFILAAISIFNPKDQWLNITWKATVEPGLAWAEVRQQLRQVLWIDKIHDSLGQAVFRILAR